jgi:hypothetical protein
MNNIMSKSCPNLYSSWSRILEFGKTIPEMSKMNNIFESSIFPF